MSVQALAKQLAKLHTERAAADVYKTLPANIREVTKFIPREWQAGLETREKRFNVEVLHRRAGKSVFKINKLIERAIECPFDDGRYAYCGPTYAQTEDIAWFYLLQFTKDIPGVREEKSKLAVHIPTRRGSTARIRLYGLDSPKQRIRGLYMDGCVFDEFAWIPPSAWTEQVRPMLTDSNRKGVDINGNENQWADFIFTPFGRNHAHTAFRNASLWAQGLSVTSVDPLSGDETTVERDDYFAYLLKASESGLIDPTELASARIDMGSAKYEQEYECSFDAAVEGAIYAREIEEARQQGRIGAQPWNKLLPVNTAWDLGWDDATAIWFFQQVGRSVRVIDYYEANGADLSHYADVLAERGYRYGYHLLPHDVEVHELGTGKSRRSVLRQLGIRVSTTPKHKVEEGIAAARAVLGRCSFDAERCADGLDRLALYRRKWDEKNQVFSMAPVHDWASHGADAFRELAMGLRKPKGSGYTDGDMSHAQY